MAAFRDADEVFLTSTGRDVQPVHRVDDRALPAPTARSRRPPPRPSPPSSPPPTTPDLVGVQRQPGSLTAVFTRPPELADETIVASLAEHWGVDAVALAYEPVGFGAHHWKATDPTGTELVPHRPRPHRAPQRRHRDRGRRLPAADGLVRRRPSAARRRPHCRARPDAHRRWPHRRPPRRAVHARRPPVPARSSRRGRSARSPHRRIGWRRSISSSRCTATPSWPLAVADEDDLVVPHAGEIPVALDELGTAWDAGPYAESARAHLDGARRRRAAPARRRTSSSPTRCASAATRRCSPTANRTPPTSSSSTTGSSSSTGTPRSWPRPSATSGTSTPVTGRSSTPTADAHRRHAVTGRRRPVPPLVGPHRDRRLPRRAPTPAHRHDRRRDGVEGAAGVPRSRRALARARRLRSRVLSTPCRSSGRFEWRPCRPPR